MSILTIPRIDYDSAPVLTINFPLLPLDDVRAWNAPAPGSEWAEGPSGTVSAWVTGTWQLLEGVVRHIPDVTTGGVTGWSSTDGWRDFLEFAWKGNSFTFIPDKATPATTVPCYLLEPRGDQPPGLDEASLMRNLRIRLRSTDGTKFDGYSLSL